jgi:hypothetical protein
MNAGVAARYFLPAEAKLRAIAARTRSLTSPGTGGCSTKVSPLSRSTRSRHELPLARDAADRPQDAINLMLHHAGAGRTASARAAVSSRRSICREELAVVTASGSVVPFVVRRHPGALLPPTLQVGQYLGANPRRRVVPHDGKRK